MTRKKILVDGYNLSLEQGTGIASYARQLTGTLSAAGHEVDVLYGLNGLPVDKLLREIAFFVPSQFSAKKTSSFWRKWRLLPKSSHSLNAEEISITGKVISSAFAERLPTFNRLWNIEDLFDRARINFDAYGRILNVQLPNKPDIVHWTYLLPIQVPGAKNIYTIHDLVPLRLPQTTLDNKARFLALSRKIAETADHIVTVSERSRQDIIELLGVSEQRVTNTYQVVDAPDCLTSKSEVEVAREIEGIFNLPYKEFLLFYGAIEPKKNVARLIEAYMASGVKTPLVIAGKLGWQYEEVLRLIEENSGDSRAEKGGRIIRLGYLSQGMLTSLIRAAKALVFPSLYEGFGLPVIEAMQLRTPVMTSTEGSLPEISGSAALLVDPYDIGAMSVGIRQLDADADLREAMVANGVVQAAKFSRQAYVERLNEIYSKL